MNTEIEPSQATGKRIWFDQSHQQEHWDWGPIPTIAEYGYRAAKEYAEKAGYEVKALSRKVTSQRVLADCDLLIIVAPYHIYLQPQELDEITKFVKNGKSLLVMSYYTGDSHHQNNLSELAKEFGVEFKSDQVVDPLHHRRHKYEILVEDIAQEQELFQGVQRLCFNQTCSLRVTPPAKILLHSSPDSFTEEADVSDTGRILSWTTTANTEVPLLAVATSGGGRFAAFGTWMVFLSEYIESEEFNNRQLYLNLLRWLTVSIPPPPTRTGDMDRTTRRRLDYERGLQRLKNLLTQQTSPLLDEFLTLEARLSENLHSGQRFGEDQTIRSERARIIASLNDLTQRAALGRTFNDLSME